MIYSLFHGSPPNRDHLLVAGPDQRQIKHVAAIYRRDTGGFNCWVERSWIDRKGVEHHQQYPVERLK